MQQLEHQAILDSLVITILLTQPCQDRNFRSGIQSGMLGDQYRNLGLLSGIGTQQQGLQQAGMDAGYNEFLRALKYGPQQLGLLSQVLVCCLHRPIQRKVKKLVLEMY